MIVEGERLIIDIDFRSEFEIARSTGTFKAILQFLPYIFVGKSDRLCQIVAAVSEAAKQSLKKKGMHVPPWRKAEYMLAKWLSASCTRANPSPNSTVQDLKEDLGEKTSVSVGDRRLLAVVTPTWQLPAVKVKSVERGAKVVTGLASLLKEKS